MDKITSKKKQDDEDKAKGCGCLIVIGIVFCIFLWMLNNSVDVVKEASIRELFYANTDVVFNSSLHQQRQDHTLRSLELAGVDIDDVFYDVVSNSSRVENLKLEEGKLISGVCSVGLSMNVKSTDSSNPRTVNIKIQFLVKERNIWKLEFAESQGVIEVIVHDEEGKCIVSDNLKIIIAMTDIIQKIKNKKDIHARDYR
jgi:hypothetical protein